MSVAVDHRRRAKRKARWRRRSTVLAFMTPWLIGFGVFIGYPLVATVYFSFTHYDLLAPARWIGLANYDYMFNHDRQIWQAVRNTLWLVAITVPLKVMFAFGVAQFRTLHAVQWNLTLAATVMVLAPVILLFFFAQKAFVEGVTLTGV